MRIVTSLHLSGALLFIWGCGGSGSDPAAGETISRETFVEAYFQLRSVGLRSPMMEIGTQARDSVLMDLGLTEEDILTFVEVWGDDGEVMQRVWEEIDSLLREDRMQGRRTEDGQEDEGEEVGFSEVGQP